MSGPALKHDIRGDSPGQRECRLTACTGKVRFGSAKLAHEVSKRRNDRGRNGNVYRCTGCGGWHIGSHLPDVRR